MRLIRRLVILVLAVVVLDGLGIVEIRRARVEALAREAKEFVAAHIVLLLEKVRD